MGGEVDWVETASAGVQAVRGHDYAACVSKLGVEGNLGTDVLGALRGDQGASPFIVLHSATAASRPDWKEELTNDLGINLFLQHGDEDQLVEAVARAIAARSVADDGRKS